MSQKSGADDFGLWALDLHLRDVAFGDGDVEAHADVRSLQPQPQIAVGDAEPKLVFCDAQQDRVVEAAVTSGFFRLDRPERRCGPEDVRGSRT